MAAKARLDGKEAHMAMALSEDVKKLIDGPNFAHLATIMPDGSPQSAPVWVTREGDRILVGTSEGSLKARNTRRDRPDRALDRRLRGSVHRGPAPRPGGRVPSGCLLRDEGRHRAEVHRQGFPWRNPGSVTLVIEVDREKFAKIPFTHAPAGAARQ